MNWEEISAAATARSDVALATARAAKAESLKGASFLDAPNIGQEGSVWRRLTTVPGRELIPVLQDRMIEICYWLWQTNPLAGWLIDITTSFIVAEGLPYEAKNEEVKAVLDAHWNDPVNRMSLNFPKFIDALHIFGEICLPAFTAAQTGRVRYGYVDPAQIRDVITDPENVMLPIGVQTKGWIGEVAGYSLSVDSKSYRIILPEETEYVISPSARKVLEKFTDGDCFYFSVNNVPNSPRGRSSLLPVADWCDAYEQFLYDYADKWPLLNSFVWDIQVDGGDDKEIKEQLKNFSKKSGSAFGHNEKVHLEASTPDLKAMEAGNGARIFRNHIIGRFGYPEHWFGGGGDVNRATASEMDLPALKMLGRRKLGVKYLIEDLLTYQIRQARAARYLKVSDEDARKFSAIMPQIESKDAAKMGTAVQQISSAVLIAEQQEWIDKESAQKIFAAITTFTGVEIDLDDVKANLEKQKAEAGYEDYKKKTVDGSPLTVDGKPNLRTVKV